MAQAMAPAADATTEPTAGMPATEVESGWRRAGRILRGLWEGLVPDQARAFAESSPGRLIGIAILLIALSASATTVTALTAHSRQHSLDMLLARTEPNSEAAHRLYTSLSVADAAASTAFISGGLEPAEVRERYSQAMGDAAANLVRLSGDGSAADQQLRTQIAAGLPVYAGLIETARANNRSGNPVGAAYLSEASNTMQTVLLPLAQQLHDRRAAEVEAAQQHHVRPPGLAMLLLIVTLVVLIWAQRLVARRWKRTFNAGLLAATAAIAVSLLWTLGAGGFSAVEVLQGHRNGSEPADRLTQSRILAQQARSAETLKLVRRDATGDYDRTFDTDTARLGDLLRNHTDPASTSANRALQRWMSTHKTMNDALNHGEFARAGTIATGSGSNNSAAQTDALDQALTDGITADRGTLRADISTASRVLDYLEPGAAVLGLAATALVAFGIWPRLREYR